MSKTETTQEAIIAEARDSAFREAIMVLEHEAKALENRANAIPQGDAWRERCMLQAKAVRSAIAGLAEYAFRPKDY